MKGPVDTSIIRRTRLKSNRRARHRRTRWLILFVAVMYVAVNLLVDIAYGLVDPRIRLS